VWAFTMATPVRAFLDAHGAAIRRAAFFCTLGSNGDQRTFRNMAALCPNACGAQLTLTEKQVAGPDWEASLAPFVAAATA